MIRYFVRNLRIYYKSSTSSVSISFTRWVHLLSQVWFYLIIVSYSIELLNLLKKKLLTSVEEKYQKSYDEFQSDGLKWVKVKYWELRSNDLFYGEKMLEISKALQSNKNDYWSWCKHQAISIIMVVNDRLDPIDIDRCKT